MSKSMVQLSVKIFHFVKPGLIKHVLLVWMELKFLKKLWCCVGRGVETNVPKEIRVLTFRALPLRFALTKG